MYFIKIKPVFPDPERRYREAVILAHRFALVGDR